MSNQPKLLINEIEDAEPLEIDICADMVTIKDVFTGHSVEVSVSELAVILDWAQAQQ